MSAFFSRLFDTSGFTPRQECGNWTAELVWLHRGSDLFVWLAYLSIPVVLIFFAWRRRALPFRYFFWLFAAFILACGFSHFVDALMFTWPAYRFGGLVKLATALLSWATVAALIPAVPALLRQLDRAGPAEPELPQPGSRLQDYLVATGSAALSVLARLALDGWLRDQYPYLLPLLAVIFVAWYAGFWPAMLTLMGSMVAVLYFFVEPRGSFVVGGMPAQLGVALFFGTGFGCALLGESQRTARLRAQAALLDSLRRQDELRQREGELLQANADLRASEGRFRTLAEAVPQIVWITRPDGYHEYYNGKWYDYTGLTPQQSVGFGWTMPLHPDDRDRAERQWKHCTESGEVYEIEYRFRRSDGEYRWFLGRALPVRDETGRVERWFGTCTDVNDQKQAEQALQERARLSAFSARVNSILVSPSQMRDALQSVCEVIVQDLGAAFARVWSLNDADNVLELQASAGLYTNLDGPHSRVPVGTFKIGLIAQEKKPHLTNEVIGDERVGNQEWARGEQMRAFAGYPLVVQDKVVGVVALFSQQPLSASTLHALATVADALALRMQRERIEQDLRDSKQQMQTLADSIPPLAWMARPDGSLFWYNQRWYDYTGTTFEQMEGWGWQSVHDPAELPRVMQKFKEHVASGEPWEDVFPLRRYDGQMRWFLSRARPVRDESGRIVRWFGTNTDVEEQRQLQEDLRQSAERFRLLMEAMPKLVWTADPSGQITFVNRRWIEYVGLSVEQARDGGWDQAVHPEDLPVLLERWRAALASGEQANYEFRIRRHSDGEYRWHLAYSVPLRDAAGSVVQWISAASDVDPQRRHAEHLELLVRQRTAKLIEEIEERIKAEKLVEAVMAELRRSNGELEQFAYVASHDLQEPLRKIQAFGDRLKVRNRDALDEQGQDYVDRMQSSAARMQLLINDLLAFSRVSTRGQEFRTVDLAAVARDVISDLEARILQTGGDVRVGPLPTLSADPLQMRQLLQNLIGNALKFQKPGVPPVVQVQATVEGDTCRLEVRDNGIGFEERYLDRIFQVFQRLHGRGAYEGTGVGLAICKKIAERHGGSITARSTPGEGSTFIVTLPLHPPTEASTNDRQEK